jgi:hypothetical protein
MNPETALLMRSFGKRIVMNYRLLSSSFEYADKEIQDFVRGRLQESQESAVTAASILIDKKYKFTSKFGQLRDKILQIQKETCTRCGATASQLYPYDFTDEETGEKVHHKLCWDCDHDVINGGDIYADASDVLQERAESDYEYDPINNRRPY